AYAPERVVVHTSTAGPALLVLSDSFYPSWSATVDGAPAPIYAANALFRGVVVPAGSHEVIFEFAPAGWAAGLWLAALGGLLLLLALSAALWLRRTRRTGGV
ncbi:MAG: YfhO family protein, partial [Caldilinea sp.]|nr:YfhO family protein [Caldilinea sp.]